MLVEVEAGASVSGRNAPGGTTSDGVLVGRGVCVRSKSDWGVGVGTCSISSDNGAAVGLGVASNDNIGETLAD